MHNNKRISSGTALTNIIAQIYVYIAYYEDDLVCVVVSLVFTTQTESMTGSPTLPPSTHFAYTARSVSVAVSVCLFAYYMYVQGKYVICRFGQISQKL